MGGLDQCYCKVCQSCNLEGDVLKINTPETLSQVFNLWSHELCPFQICSIKRMKVYFLQMELCFCFSGNIAFGNEDENRKFIYGVKDLVHCGKRCVRVALFFC